MTDKPLTAETMTDKKWLWVIRSAVKYGGSDKVRRVIREILAQGAAEERKRCLEIVRKELPCDCNNEGRLCGGCTALAIVCEIDRDCESEANND